MEPMRHLSQRLQEPHQPLPEGSDNENQVNIVLSDREGSAATASVAVGSNKECKKINRHQSANAATHQQHRGMPLKVHNFSVRNKPSVSALVSEQRRQL